jgi:predicted AlkP superfamily pyrophosphatase or phosphodiesterase
LNLGQEQIHPFYAGRSILNLPASVCGWLGAPGLGAEPLAFDVHASLDSRYTRVIVVLMDALAYTRLKRWMEDGTVPIWQELARRGLIAPITSITPSTTSAGLTTLWTGRSAAEHGITGYEMWMKEYGIVVNTILQMPITFKSDLGALERTGFEPEKFLRFKTLGTHLKEYGIKTYALQHRSIAHSGLSRMLLKDADVNSFSTPADLWVNLRHLLESRLDERLFAWVYWGEVDFFGHFYGPDDERTAAEFAIFSQAMRTLFLDPLSQAARRDTLLILTADHGHLVTQPDDHYDLRRHPNLTRRLHLLPTGENRLAYLYIKPGQTEAVREVIERTWPGQFCLIESAYAVETGLFGGGEMHPDLLDRVGDLIVVGLGNAYLWWANKENVMIGRHGALHADEMLVPFLAAPL